MNYFTLFSLATTNPGGGRHGGHEVNLTTNSADHRISTYPGPSSPTWSSRSSYCGSTGRYFITYHQWNSKPEFVFATHHVVSYEDVVNRLSKERQPSGNSIGRHTISEPTLLGQ